MLPPCLTSCRRGARKQLGGRTPLRGSLTEKHGALDPLTSLILAVTEQLEAKRDRMPATPLAPFVALTAAPASTAIDR